MLSFYLGSQLFNWIFSLLQTFFFFDDWLFKLLFNLIYLVFHTFHDLFKGKLLSLLLNCWLNLLFHISFILKIILQFFSINNLFPRKIKTVNSLCPKFFEVVFHCSYYQSQVYEVTYFVHEGSYSMLRILFILLLCLSKLDLSLIWSNLIDYHHSS